MNMKVMRDDMDCRMFFQCEEKDISTVIIYLFIAVMGILYVFGGYGALSKVYAQEAVAEHANGTYEIEVTMSGGSGKASIGSPADIMVQDGKVTARIIFSSPNYDYMRVGEQTYYPVNTEGNSTFEIPVTTFDSAMEVVADTTAMSTPHEITYTLYFDSSTISANGSKELNNEIARNAFAGAGDLVGVAAGGLTAVVICVVICVMITKKRSKKQ